MVIRNNLIPFKGYLAINICGLIFVRKDVKVDSVLLNHEYIHTRQMIETFFIGFYVWYILEFLIRLLIYRDWTMAYRNISFEREAYRHEKDLAYTKYRPIYRFLKYM